MGTAADATANAILNALVRGTSYAGNATFWVQLHTGDPGAAGTSNQASNATRKQATFGNAAASRTIANTATVQWTGVPTQETYSWVSYWDASSSGNFLGRDDFSVATGVNVGDTFTIPIGNITATVT